MGLTSAANAQRVTGSFDDATVLPRGMVRVTISPTWNRAHERFADGTGSRRKGEVEPLAADFDLDSLGVSVLPALAPVQAGLQAILGAGAMPAVSAGRLLTRFDASVAHTPLLAEYGVTSRLTLGVMVPLVRTRTEVSVNPNPTGTEATVGLNPAWTNTQARAANAMVVSQLTAASQQLQQRLQDCAGSSDPSCSAINADRAAAQQLVTAAANAATGIENVYGVSAARPGTPFSPVHFSSLQQGVEARLAALSTGFSTFLGAPAGEGWISAQPVGAPPLAYADLQQVIADSAFGILADTLQSVERRSIGDMEIGAKFLLFDSFGGEPPQRAEPGAGFRVSAAALVRLGTGLRETPFNLVDIGTGDGQLDMEGRVFADVILGRRFWASVVARYGVQRPDVQSFRVPDAPHQPFPPASRLVALRRDLGDYLMAEVSPRLIVTENIGFAASYQYLSKGEDSYTLAPGAVVDPDSVAAFDPAVLAVGTARHEQRALVAVTYSNLAAYYRGRARIPMEVSLTVGRTLSGDGNAPRASITGLSFRFYNRLFGR